ncbi:MAG: 1-acyl-sn-glycerol-3-phosphate acyltransferase [Dehalococcoidia bacterium]|nr:1-acyl-sn-glycerol-3-phosphate acyltransferase [Dehalococcoidia bacterium]
MTDQSFALESSGIWSLPRQESRLQTYRRRALTGPGYLLAGLLAFALAPVVYPLALLVDIAGRRRLATVRAIAMAHVYLASEAAGMAASAWIWLTRGSDRERYLERNFHLQCWWAGTLFRAGARLFSLRVEVDGDELARTGPVLVFSRHVSPIDNLLPAVLISDAHGIRLRWVINRSLLRDPCLDIVGNRLPNCFVAAGTGDSEAEIRRVQVLGHDLGSRDGVLIFPEGALFSPSRLERVLSRIEESGDEHLLARARRLQNLLPPRLGGSTALLEAARGTDVVFLAHTGLEGATEYHNILRGGLIGRTVRVRIWRVPAEEIPQSRDERAEWLFDQWDKLDSWVSANQPAALPR